MEIYDKAMIQALAEYVEASDKNTKESDETWAAGFRIVQEKLDKLHQFFTTHEIEAIIMSKEKIRVVFQNVGLLEQESRING